MKDLKRKTRVNIVYFTGDVGTNKKSHKQEVNGEVWYTEWRLAGYHTSCNST